MLVCFQQFMLRCGFTICMDVKEGTSQGICPWPWARGRPMDDGFGMEPASGTMHHAWQILHLAWCSLYLAWAPVIADWWYLLPSSTVWQSFIVVDGKCHWLRNVQLAPVSTSVIAMISKHFCANCFNQLVCYVQSVRYAQCILLKCVFYLRYVKYLQCVQ